MKLRIHATSNFPNMGITTCLEKKTFDSVKVVYKNEGYC